MATGIPDFLTKLFARNAEVLGWKWIPDDHVIDANQQVITPSTPFAVKQDYVVLRLAEMYLRQTRRLWREYYPVVHAFVEDGDQPAKRTVATLTHPRPPTGPRTPPLARLRVPA